MGLDGIQNYVIGIILFAVVITGGLTFMGYFYAADASIDPTSSLQNFSGAMNKSAEVAAGVGSIKASISSLTSTDSSLLDRLNGLVGTVTDGLRVIGDTFGFMDVAAEGGARVLGIPVVFVVLLSLVAVVIIGFAIWSAILKV